MAENDYSYRTPYIPGYGRDYDPRSMEGPYGPYGAAPPPFHVQWAPRPSYMPSPISMDPMMSASSMFNVRQQPDSFLGGIGNLMPMFAGPLSQFMPGLSSLFQSGAATYNGAPTFLFKTNFNRDMGMSSFGTLFMRNNTAAGGAFGSAGADINRRRWRGTLGSASAGDTAMMADQILAGVLPGIWNGFDNFMGYDRGAAENVFGGVGGIRAMAGMRALMGGTRGLMNPLGEDFNSMRQAAALTGANLVAETMYGRFDEATGRSYLGLAKNTDVFGATERAMSMIVERALEGNANAVIERDAEGNVMRRGRLGDLYNLQQRAGSAGELLERGDNRTAAETEEFRALLDQLRGEGYLNREVEGRRETVARNEDVTKDVIDRAVTEIKGALTAGTKDFARTVTQAVDSMKDLFGNEDAAMDALDILTGGAGFRNSEVARRIQDRVDDLKILGMNAGLAPNQIGEQVSGILGALGAGRTGIGRGTAWNGSMALDLSRMFMSTMPYSDSRTQQALLQAQQEFANANSDSNSYILSTILASMNQSGQLSDEEFNALGGFLKTGRIEGVNQLMGLVETRMGVTHEGFLSMMNDRALIDTMGAGLRPEYAGKASALNAAAMEAEMGRFGRSGTARSGLNRLSMNARAAGFSSDRISGTRDVARFGVLRGAISGTASGTALDREHARNMERFGGDEGKAARATLEWARMNEILEQSGIGADKISDTMYAMESAGTDQLRAMLGGVAVANEGGFLGDLATRYGSLVATGPDEDRRTFNAETLGQIGSALRGMNGDRRIMNISGFGEKMKVFQGYLDQGNVGKAADELDRIFKQALDDKEITEEQYRMVQDRLGRQYRTTDVVGREKRDNDVIAAARRNQDVGKYFAGVSSDEARNAMADLVLNYDRMKQGGNATEEQLAAQRRLMQAMQEAENARRGGDAEKIARAIESGDVSQLMDVLRNGNITPEAYQAALAELAGGAEDMFATSADLTSARLEDVVSGKEGTRAERELKFLKGAGSRLGLSGLRKMSEEDLGKYAGIIGADASEYGALVKTAGDASLSAEERFEAEKKRLELEKKSLTDKANELGGDKREGESDEDFANRKALAYGYQTAAAKRGAQLESIGGPNGPGAAEWAAYADREAKLAEEKENSSLSLEEIVKKIADIVPQLESIAKSTAQTATNTTPGNAREGTN